LFIKLPSFEGSLNRLKDRYDKEYEYKGVQFYLSDCIPNEEECRIIILKIIEQASRDYLSLYKGKTAALRHNWETARDFIFKDKYLINWGGVIMSPAQLMELVEIDIDWLRRKTNERFSRIERKDNG
jgi:hypothetical protein